MSSSSPSPSSAAENGSDLNKELDIVEHWSGRTIGDALSEGDELIHQKLLLLKGQTERCLELKSHKERKRKIKTRRKVREKKVEFFFFEPNTSQTKDPRKCPLRILELAAPTKRHCMETWRNKSHVLPVHMMDRLRQHVQDERPIFEIPEALKCFAQNKRTIISRKTHSRLREEIHVKDILNCKDTAILCAIFGYRISQKLLPCLKVDLHYELQKVCSVVYSDIEDLVKRGSFKNKKHYAYISDTADKITFWIAGILDDAYFKQIEEDFKDLQKEEGVVWDVLDDLFKIVADLCIHMTPSPMNSSRTSQGSLSEMDIDTENNLSAEDHIKNEINKIIDGISQENEFHDAQEQDNLSSGQSVDDSKDKIAPNSDDIDSSRQSDEDNDSNKGATNNDVDSYERSNEDKNQDIPDVTVEQETAKKDNDTIQDIFISDNTAATNQGSADLFSDMAWAGSKTNTPLSRMANDNDRNEELHDDLLDEESDKKVKFSPVRLDSIRRLGQLIENSNDDKTQTINDETERKPPDIVLGGPNKNLLSDMDEVWPTDLDPYAIKITASVSKSITSLGKITETIEKQNNLMRHDGRAHSLTILQESDNDGDDEEEIMKHNFESKQASKPDRDLVTGQTTQISSQDKTKDNKNNLVDNTPKNGQTDDLRTNIKHKAQSKLQDPMQLNSLEVTKRLKDSEKMERKINDNEGYEKISTNTNENIHSLDDTFVSKIGTTTAVTRSSDLITTAIETYKTRRTSAASPKVNESKDNKKRTHMTKETKHKKYKTNGSTISLSKLKSKIKTTIWPSSKTTISKDYHIPIFDYKVNVSNVPFWLNESTSCKGFNNREALKKRQDYLRKWCKNLTMELDSMRVWNHWMQDACKTIIDFKTIQKDDARAWINLKHNIDKSVTNWERNFQQFRKILNLFKNVSLDINPLLSSTHSKCGCNSITQMNKRETIANQH